MFRDIIDEEVKAVFKKRKIMTQKKIMKEKKMHVELMKFSFIESIHLKKLLFKSFFFVRCMLSFVQQ